MDDPAPRFAAYETDPQEDMPITTAPGDREWMDRTDRRFAYRCLPLVIANRAGWLIPSPANFVAVWNGSSTPDSVRITFGAARGAATSPPTTAWGSVSTTDVAQEEFVPENPDARISSHFGSGIITFTVPYVFRTPPGINLWVKGPTNLFKDGIQALEAIVETDWLAATFTMNWKLTRPHHPVTFRRGEPICMVVPVTRRLAESLDPVRMPLAQNPELDQEYREWERSRRQFMGDLSKGETAAAKQGWQKHYYKGENQSGERAPEHQTALRLKEFRRIRGPEAGSGG